jgi:hypothetical protein
MKTDTSERGLERFERRSPIDPLFSSLRRLPDYERISRALALRASSDSRTPQSRTAIAGAWPPCA